MGKSLQVLPVEPLEIASGGFARASNLSLDAVAHLLVAGDLKDVRPAGGFEL
jgi:hypothetical protein